MDNKKKVVLAILGLALAVDVAGYAERVWHPRTTKTAAERAYGKELDRQFVEALITRYQDTMALAEQQKLHGHNPELKKLAGAILEARRHDLDSLLQVARADRELIMQGPTRSR